MDIGSIKAADKGAACVQFQALHDVTPRGRIRCGGQGNAGNSGETLGQNRKRRIIRPKIMAPLGQTMRFINGKQGQFAPLQKIHKLRHHQPFGRHIDQIQCSGPHLLTDLLNLMREQARMNGRRRNPQLRQSPHLILHQGNQGRDPHPHPIQTQRGNLITQRFPRPRGHHNKGVLATRDMLNNRLLLSPKRGIAKGFLQDADGGGHGEGRWRKNKSALDKLG